MWTALKRVFGFAKTDPCYLIAFRGLQGLCDDESVRKIATLMKLEAKFFQYTEMQDALEFARGQSMPYALLGFSKGAETARAFIDAQAKKKSMLPFKTLIVGPYGGRSYQDLKVDKDSIAVYRDYSGRQGTDGEHMGGEHLGPNGIMARVYKKLCPK